MLKLVMHACLQCIHYSIGENKEVRQKWPLNILYEEKKNNKKGFNGSHYNLAQKQKNKK